MGFQHIAIILLLEDWPHQESLPMLAPEASDVTLVVFEGILASARVLQAHLMYFFSQTWDKAWSPRNPPYFSFFLFFLVGNDISSPQSGCWMHSLLLGWSFLPCMCMYVCISLSLSVCLTGCLSIYLSTLKVKIPNEFYSLHKFRTYKVLEKGEPSSIPSVSSFFHNKNPDSQGHSDW